MRYTAIFPVICAFIALVLSFLCVFAGSKQGYMESYDIITLNTSRIGVDIFDTSDPSKSRHQKPDSGDLLGDLIHDATNEIHHLADKVEGEVEDAVNNVLVSFAKVVGMHDFYSVHVLDFCDGYFSPRGSSERNVTDCSNTKGFFSFSPSKTFQRELNANGVNVTLSDLHWPSAIDEAVDTLKLAFNVMFVLYCLGIAATGLAFAGSLAGIFLVRNSVALVNIFLTQLAFFSMMVASAIVTGAADQAAHVINKYGKEIDINATRGSKLIALTWTAVLLMFVASISWVLELLWSRRKQKKLEEKELA